MNRQLIVTATSSLLTLLGAHTLVHANEPNIDWNAQAQLGYQYDSNVNIRELDQNTERADQALVIDAQLGLQWRPWQAFEVKAGIHHSNYAYQQFDEFDLAITTINGDISYDLDWVKLGVSRHHAKAKLAAEDFLRYQQDSFYLSRIWGQQWFTRLAYDAIDKRFANLSERDATADAVSADIYWFTESAKSFITAGYSYHDERATNPQFDYTGTSVRVRWQTQAPLWGREHTWQLGWQLEQRDYLQSMPDETFARTEQRHTVSAKWQIPLNDSFQLIPQLDYVDNQSNFADADYQETTASLNLKVQF